MPNVWLYSLSSATTSLNNDEPSRHLNVLLCFNALCVTQWHQHTLIFFCNHVLPSDLHCIQSDHTHSRACRGHLTINYIYQTIKISGSVWRPFNYYCHISDNTESNSGVTPSKTKRYVSFIITVACGLYEWQGRDNLSPWEKRTNWATCLTRLRMQRNGIFISCFSLSRCNDKSR
jgi:hypothetical protein